MNKSVIGVLLKLRNFHRFNGTAHFTENILEQVVRHRPRHLDAFNFCSHGRGLQETDPNRQVKFIVRVLEDNNRRFSHRVQGQAANGHLNRIFPFGHSISPSDWKSETRSAVMTSPISELAVAPIIRTGSKDPTRVSSPVKFTIRLVRVRPITCPFLSLDLPSTKTSSTLPMPCRFLFSDISFCNLRTSCRRSFLISSTTS